MPLSGSEAVAETATEVPETVVPPNGAVKEIRGAVMSGTALLTVTVVPAESVVFPAASLATAVRVWVPFEVPVVLQVVEYGDVVSSVPRFAPSSLNWTPATPTLSVADAETATEPETVEPFAGAVKDTEGAMVSAVVFTRKSSTLHPSGALS